MRKIVEETPKLRRRKEGKNNIFKKSPHQLDEARVVVAGKTKVIQCTRTCICMCDDPTRYDLTRCKLLYV